ncbi:hypothetical protein [Caulobacter sp. LARHSG274]
MASDTPSTPAAGPNKAQAEFDKYARRRKAQAESGVSAPGSAATGGPKVAASGSFSGGTLSWAVPLGVGMAPAYPGGPGMGPGGQDPGGGGLIAGIGTTARLGVDLLNAALFSGVKILGGFTGAYDHGRHEDCGCGSGYACGSCCEPSCCEPDCCGCESCHPGVGSCC